MSAKDLSQSAGVLFDERRDFYLSDRYTKELWKDVSPFVTMLANLSYDSVRDPDFKMFEHRAGFIEQTLTVGAAGGSVWSVDGSPGDTTTVTIAALDGLGDSVGEWLVDMNFEIYSDADVYGGVARIQSVNGSDVTLVSQGNPADAGNLADAIANDFVLECIGPAIGEGEVSPEAFADELEVVYNTTQIMRTPVEVTGTLYEAALRGYSNELARLRTQKSYEHKIQKERTMLTGVRVGGTGMGAGDNFGTIQNNANGNKIRQTMGAISALRKYGSSTVTDEKQNVFSIDEDVDGYTQLVENAEKISQYLPSRGRFSAFASRKWISWFSTAFLNNTASNGITIYNDEKSEFGYRIMRVVTPHCEIDIAPTPVLRRRYADTMLVVNPDAIGLKRYRPMKYSTNIKTENGYDGVKDEFFSDEGLMIQLIETHSLWTLA